MQGFRKLFLCSVAAEHTEGCISQLRNSNWIVARGVGAVQWLKRYEITPDRVFQGEPAQSLNQAVDDLLSGSPTESTVAYVTWFFPLNADQLALELCSRGTEDQVRGMENAEIRSLFPPRMQAGHPLVMLDGLLLQQRHSPPFSADDAVLLFDPLAVKSAPELRQLLRPLYPPDHPIFRWDLQSEGEGVWMESSLDRLEEQAGGFEAIYLPPASRDSSLESFQEIIAHLRAPEDGCPWDKKQTHDSLRTYLLEETYEALDALDTHDLSGLQEELGDILLQILLHAQIATEKGEFTMGDVLSHIHRKIVYRHPHVFKDWVVNGEQDVVQNWEALKEQERLKKGNDQRKGMLDGVPHSYPALAQAQAIQDRAARVGFDWPDIAPVLDKVIEELNEVKIDREKHLLSSTALEHLPPLLHPQH